MKFLLFLNFNLFFSVILSHKQEKSQKFLSFLTIEESENYMNETNGKYLIDLENLPDDEVLLISKKSQKKLENLLSDNYTFNRNFSINESQNTINRKKNAFYADHRLIMQEMSLNGLNETKLKVPEILTIKRKKREELALNITINISKIDLSEENISRIENFLLNKISNDSIMNISGLVLNDTIHDNNNEIVVFLLIKNKNKNANKTNIVEKIRNATILKEYQKKIIKSIKKSIGFIKTNELENSLNKIDKKIEISINKENILSNSSKEFKANNANETENLRKNKNSTPQINRTSQDLSKILKALPNEKKNFTEINSTSTNNIKIFNISKEKKNQTIVAIKNINTIDNTTNMDSVKNEELKDLEFPHNEKDYLFKNNLNEGDMKENSKNISIRMNSNPIDIIEGIPENESDFSEGFEGKNKDLFQNKYETPKLVNIQKDSMARNNIETSNSMDIQKDLIFNNSKTFEKILFQNNSNLYNESNDVRKSEKKTVNFMDINYESKFPEFKISKLNNDITLDKIGKDLIQNNSKFIDLKLNNINVVDKNNLKETSYLKKNHDNLREDKSKLANSTNTNNSNDDLRKLAFKNLNFDENNGDIHIKKINLKAESSLHPLKINSSVPEFKAYKNLQDSKDNLQTEIPTDPPNLISIPDKIERVENKTTSLNLQPSQNYHTPANLSNQTIEYTESPKIVMNLGTDELKEEKINSEIFKRKAKSDDWNSETMMEIKKMSIPTSLGKNQGKEINS